MHYKGVPWLVNAGSMLPSRGDFFLKIEANLCKFYAVTVSLNLQQTWLLCNSMVWIDICKTRSAWIETFKFFFQLWYFFLGKYHCILTFFFSSTVVQIIYSVTQLKSTYSRLPDTFPFLKFWAWKLWIISFVGNRFIFKICKILIITNDKNIKT